MTASTRPLRLAIAQLKYVPNHKPVGAGVLPLAQQPLIPLGSIKVPQELEALLVSAQHEQLRSALRRSGRDITDAHEKQRIENLDKKLRQVLQYCHRNNVDILVLPECFVPPQILTTLLGFDVSVFAGVGLLRQSDISILTEAGFPADQSLIGCNAAIYASSTDRTIVTKKYGAQGEDIEAGSGVAVAKVNSSTVPRTVGLAVCKDYLRDIEVFRTAPARVEAVLATMLTPTITDFASSPPRDFVRAFSNWSFDGQSAFSAPSIAGVFGQRAGTEPVPRGQQAVVIIDWDFYPPIPSPLVPPRNRVIRYASILDVDHSVDGSRITDTVKEMSGWTIEDYRRGAYGESLRLLGEALGAQNDNILAQAIQILSQQDDYGASLTKDDFAVLTSHIVLEDVLREEELRYRLLEDLIERWHRDLRTFPSADAALFMAAAEAQRRELEAKVRIRYRSNRHVSPGIGFQRKLGEGVDSRSPATFYSARLGQYDIQQAVETLPRQLDLLRTIASSRTSSVCLAYRISTELSPSEDLEPIFDVFAAAAGEAKNFDELLAGIGEQIGTVFASGYNISGTGHSYVPKSEWLAQLALPARYVPAINDDWAPLVDYLRSLPFPLQIQMTVSPALQPSPPLDVDILSEPLGFLSDFEQAAAAFFTRAGRIENSSEQNLELAVHVGAAEEVPPPVLRTIAQWLLRTDRWTADVSEHARDSLIEPGAVTGTAVLTPAQAIRIFHPPYGRMAARGLTGDQKTNIPLPARFISTSGIQLGTARIASPREDRSIAVHISPASRKHHLYILGRSGSGKTNLLKNLARQDITAGNGLAVIDPHGDLIDYLVEHVAGREDEVTLLDFGNREYLPVLNPLDLDIRGDFDLTLAIEEFIDLVERQSYHEFYGPRFEDLVRLAIESVLDGGYPLKVRSLVDFPPILRSEESREWLRWILTSNDLKSRWNQFEGVSPTEKAEVLHWALAKFSELTKDNILGQVLGGGASSVSIRSVVERNGILLVKVPEWEMSRSAADFIGAFVQERIRRAIYSRWRQSINNANIPPFNLYVDEFQQFATTRFEEMLAEARKFGLCLTLANQNVRQLEQFSRHTGGTSSSLLEAVFGNVSSLVFLGGSSRDAEILAPELRISRERLDQLPRFSAAARVLFEHETAICTLDFPLATAVAGLPRSGDAVRKAMVEKGVWLKRDALRSRLEARFEHIAELVADATRVTRRGTAPISGHPDAADMNPPRSDEPPNDQDDLDRDPPDLTISWPCPDNNNLGGISYSLCNGMLHIIVKPHNDGFRFVKKWVRFARGTKYRALKIRPYEDSSIPHKIDRLPLVVTVPYEEGAIEKVSYTLENDAINIIYRFAPSAPTFSPKQVTFIRGSDPCVES